VQDAFVYHSGTYKINDRFVTSGGRVLGVSAQADSLDSAIAKAYSELAKISFNNNVYRRDIGRNLR
jgi:phosphoribosylamine--glycine ligase